MTWVSIKIFFKKSYAWCVQHWRWLLFAIVALVAYLSGRRSAKNLWIQAELARKHYKKESEMIEKEYEDKNKKIIKIEEENQRKLEEIENQRIQSNKDLEVEKRRNMIRLVSDEKEIDQSLEDMGIDEV